jgi:signal transduction histidine kinase
VRGDKHKNGKVLRDEHRRDADATHLYNDRMATPPLEPHESDALDAAAREEQRLQRLRHLAEMGALAAGLAHELRNPLSTIKLHLQLLEEDLRSIPGFIDPSGKGSGVGERSVTRINTLKREADRLRQTLDDFLNYTGRIELRVETVSLNSLVEELVDFLLPQAQVSRVRVHTALAPEDPQCRLDVKLFKQALLNLLLNALQAMPLDKEGPEGSTRELHVRTIVSPNSAILYVSDTGVGIPFENLAKIFAPYFTTKKGGTGLGLPTTRRIIEEHKGHITVESNPGQGTSFRVELPLAPPSPPAPKGPNIV